MLVLCWCYVGVMLVLCWCYVGVMLVLCWCYVGVMLTLCWYYVGLMLTLCSKGVNLDREKDLQTPLSAFYTLLGGFVITFHKIQQFDKKYSIFLRLCKRFFVFLQAEVSKPVILVSKGRLG